MVLNKKKIFLISTEPSGDLLGYDLILHMYKRLQNIEIIGIGGEKMNQLKFKSFFSTEGMNVNGIVEVLLKLKKFIKCLSKVKQLIIQTKPDIVITIDSPSFNFRIVKKLQFLRPKTKFVHLVAPTVWAWKKYRAKRFANNYDLILTLFDFEPRYFTRYNKNTFCIGHPIFYKKKINTNNKKNTITFFPGSRENEIEYILPKMILVYKKLTFIFKDINFAIVTLPSLEKKILNEIGNCKIDVVSSKINKMRVLKDTKLAIAASGTVILELSRNLIPTIVVYDSNFFTSIVIKYLVKLKWANLVNIILNKDTIPEYLFSNYSVDKVVNNVELFLKKRELYEKQIYDFLNLKSKMLINKQNPMDLALEYIKNRL